MRRQGHGTLVYTGSTTAHIPEPSLGPYAAAKAAGDVLAEVIGMEVRAFGLDTIIIVPGAFTAGTEHFVHAVGPARPHIVTPFGQLAARADNLGQRLAEHDTANGAPLNITPV